MESYRIVIDSELEDYRLLPLSVTTVSQLEPVRATLLGNGVVRLFRNFEEETSETTCDSTVSIIALPTYFTATDLLGFIGDRHIEYITHIRILKSEKPNRFLVLLKFADMLRALDFQYNFDGKPFNAMEPESCHVVFVELVYYPDCQSQELLPFLVSDPFTGNSAPLELPTCPVCLERLDYHVTGLLTIPCQHTFHCLCLSKWLDDTCPVCRYSNNIVNHNVRKTVRRLSQINSSRLQLVLVPKDEVCMGCDATLNLWVCVICGNVGCDRYAPEQHLLKHFVETGHCFAMELNTLRVWDYVGDNYVHRLIADGEGKIVELPDKSPSEEKSSEYLDLLLSQLVSQREYYELLLSESGRPRRPTWDRQEERKLRGEVEALRGEVEALRAQQAQTEKEMEEMRVKLRKMAVVVPALEKKIAFKDTSLKLMAKEMADTSTLNEGLSKKVGHLAEENKLLKQERDDLQEQVRDLMFFLESREKFADQPEDVKQGRVVVGKGKGKR